MTLDELQGRLRDIAEADDDPESAHATADSALLDYIGDPTVAALYDAIEKWYA